MYYFLMIFVFVADQITKYWIQSNISTVSGTEVIKNFFYITYVKNTGAAWSMLSGQQVFLSITAAVAIVVMLVLLEKYRKTNDKITCFALSLMVAGAAGNLVDRLLLNFVRDFLNFYIFGYDFPVFNVADIALCCGVFLLLISTLLEDEKK